MKTRKTIRFIALLLSAMLLQVTIMKAQSLEPFSPYGFNVPGVEAWSMTRFGGVSPSLYNGAMTYSYPVFNYEDHDFSIPISLEYSFEGYRPSQHSGSVGYGWHLNCGGVITREVRGLPDEGPYSDSGISGYLFHDQMSFDTPPWSVTSVSMNVFGDLGTPDDSTPSAQYFADFISSFDFFSDVPVYHDPSWQTTQRYDTASDLYHFSFLGHHGDFVLLPDGSVHVFNSDLPDGEISADVHGEPGYRAVLSFSITTGDGYVYHFGGSTGKIEYSYSLYSSYVVPVSFYLWRIDAPNGRHAEFSFAEDKAMSVSSTVHYSPITQVDGDGSSVSVSEIQHLAGCTCTPIPEGFSIDGITVARFSYTHREADENSGDCFDDLGRQQVTHADVFDPVTDNTSLSSVVIYNRQGETVDSFTLSRTVVHGDSPKSFLSSIHSLKGGLHSFAYNLPSGMVPPHSDTQSLDHWGFWNGSGVTDLRTYLSTGEAADLYSQMSVEVRNASFIHSSFGALVSITFPTGGSTAISYESHVVSRRINSRNGGDPSSATVDICATPYVVGGVRVRSITDSAEDMTSTTTYLYEYGDGTSSGLLSSMPKYRYSMACEFRYGVSGYHFNVSSNGYTNSCSFMPNRESHVGYSEVRKIYPDGSLEIKRFSCNDDPYMDYYDSNDALTTDKHVLSMIDRITERPGNRCGFTFVPVIDRHPMRGLLLSTENYDSEGRIMRNEILWYSEDIFDQGYTYLNAVTSFIRQDISYAIPRVYRKTVNEYHVGGSVSETSTYEYNSLGQLYCTTTSNSSGETVKEYRKYLHQTNSSALKSLISDAVMTKVVNGQERLVALEKYSYSNPALNSRPSSITEYGVAGSIISSSNVFAVPSGSQSRTTTITYDSQYRPTNISRPGGAYTSYSWSGRNPVSRTDNASSNTTEYSWKDLVGLTAVNRPDGTSETYQYNSRNRLWKTFNSSGNLIQRNDVHLENEM